MSDTVIGWTSPLVRSARSSLADVLLCPSLPSDRSDELCDRLLRQHPGAVVVLLVPLAEPTASGCLRWSEALHVVACAVHTTVCAGIAPPSQQVLPVRCPCHRRSTVPCVLVDLVAIGRRGFRQGFEATPHFGSP
jgi:hypothetical protein